MPRFCRFRRSLFLLSLLCVACDAPVVETVRSDAQPRLLWTRQLGSGYSGIVARHDRLYTMYRRGKNEVVISLELDLVVATLEFDGALRSLEVVSLIDLFDRLIDGVVDLLEIDSRRHIEGIVRHIA